jgi:hypothetical protein
MSTSLNSHRETISANVETLDEKPYSHNIISITLSMIASTYGNGAANEAIEDFGLADLGWEQQV